MPPPRIPRISRIPRIPPRLLTASLTLLYARQCLFPLPCGSSLAQSHSHSRRWESTYSRYEPPTGSERAAAIARANAAPPQERPPREPFQLPLLRNAKASVQRASGEIIGEGSVDATPIPLRRVLVGAKDGSGDAPKVPLSSRQYRTASNAQSELQRWVPITPQPAPLLHEKIAGQGENRILPQPATPQSLEKTPIYAQGEPQVLKPPLQSWGNAASVQGELERGRLGGGAIPTLSQISPAPVSAQGLVSPLPQDKPLTGIQGGSGGIGGSRVLTLPLQGKVAADAQREVSHVRERGGRSSTQPLLPPPQEKEVAGLQTDLGKSGVLRPLPWKTVVRGEAGRERKGSLSQPSLPIEEKVGIEVRRIWPYEEEEEGGGGGGGGRGRREIREGEMATGGVRRRPWRVENAASSKSPPLEEGLGIEVRTVWKKGGAEAGGGGGNDSDQVKYTGPRRRLPNPLPPPNQKPATILSQTVLPQVNHEELQSVFSQEVGILSPSY